MAKKKTTELKINILERLEQSKDDYITYQNKKEGQSLIDPDVCAFVLLGLQRDILNLYTLLIEIEKQKK